MIQQLPAPSSLPLLICGFLSSRYPAPIGLEGSGVVVAVGSAVKNLKVGDEVYGAYIEKPMFRKPPAGFAAEYALAEEDYLLPKPAHLSWEEAASMTSVVVTSYQTWRRGMQLMGVQSLEGKTVYIPAGLSSTGSMAALVARNVLGAEKIITTVSTPKLELVERYMPGVYDQVIDYKTQRPRDQVPRGSVDVMYNTQWNSMDEGIPMLNPKTGVLISIASAPGKEVLKKILGPDRFPWWAGVLVDLAQLIYKWKLRGTNIPHEFVSGGVEIREDLEAAGEIVAREKVTAVMRVVEFKDLQAVRKGCDEVYTGKGGIGKLVVKIV